MPRTSHSLVSFSPTLQATQPRKAMLQLEFGVSSKLHRFLLFRVAGAAANQQWFATSPGAISWPSRAKEVCQVRAKLGTSAVANWSSASVSAFPGIRTQSIRTFGEANLKRLQEGNNNCPRQKEKEAWEGVERKVDSQVNRRSISFIQWLHCPGAWRWWTPLSVQMRIPCSKLFQFSI